MNAPKTLVWLHLSDLHLCELKTGWDAHRVLKPLIEDLQQMEKSHGLLPQLLFFTGDAAFGKYQTSSLADQYAEVETFLTGVREAFSQAIPKDHTFLVPGNHDVDRTEVTDSETHWLEKQATADNVTQLIKDKSKQWRLFMDRLTAYRTFLEQNAYTHLLEDPDRLIYSQIRDINGIKLGIGGFNSAWNCSRDKEKAKLWLAADWQDGTIVRGLNKQTPDLKVALIHHPPGWFVEQEDALLARNMENHFDFFLHGHEHQDWVSYVNNRHVRIAAAACYEKSDQSNGYNFVRLNLETGDVEIWLRMFNGQGAWIPRILAGDKKDNNGLWSIKAIPCLTKLIKPSGKRNTDQGKTNDAFIDKVREKIKEILDTEKPGAMALRAALLSGHASGALPENILIPKEHISPDVSISEWLKIILTCLSQARGHLVEIKHCASEIMGWLLLLCVNSDHAIDVDKTKEILVPVNTETGTEVFIARLEQRSAKFQPKGTDTALGEGYVDPGDLELAFFKTDQLQQIQQLVYIKAFGNIPNLDKDWLGLLRDYLEINANITKKMTYLTLSKIRYSEHLDMIKNLKKALPHLQVLIVGVDNNGGNSVLIMDESRIEAYVLTFLKIMADY